MRHRARSGVHCTSNVETRINRMCLAVPARIIELRPDSMALVDIQGTQREVSLMVLDGDAAGANTC